MQLGWRVACRRHNNRPDAASHTPRVGLCKRQAAVTSDSHPLNRIHWTLDGSRFICTSLTSYTDFYVLKTTCSLDEIVKNGSILRVTMSVFAGETVRELQQFLKQSCAFSRIRQGWAPWFKPSWWLQMAWLKTRKRWPSENYMGQVTELWLSCYLVLLSTDSKTR